MERTCTKQILAGPLKKGLFLSNVYRKNIFLSLMLIQSYYFLFFRTVSISNYKSCSLKLILVSHCLLWKEFLFIPFYRASNSCALNKKLDSSDKQI